MKHERGLVLASLILLSMVLFLVFVSEGREERFLLQQARAEAEAAAREQAQAQAAEEARIRTEAAAIGVDLLYTEHAQAYPYYLVLDSVATVRSEPSEAAVAVAAPRRFDRLAADTAAFAVSDPESSQVWLPVLWEQDGERFAGFLDKAAVEERTFDFAQMEAAVRAIDEGAAAGRLAHIESHRYPRGAAALGYPSLGTAESPVVLEDGTLVRRFYESGRYTRIAVLSTGRTYFVDSGFLSEEPVARIQLVIVVDRNNQNEAAFEKRDGRWFRISETLATTGTSGRYSRPTPLGFFLAMEKKEQFVYYEDGTTRIQGYAPYAIRFTGRAYIHGVPVDFRQAADGSRIRPPMQEYSRSIGTIPLSHKCVRNYTSHAKFLYDRFVEGETAVAVIE